MPFEEEKLTEINWDLNDPVLQQVYDLQDRQLLDSLYLFFRQKDPSYRYAAAMAFGSIKGRKGAAGVDSLIRLLKDEVTGVRLGAAYALGQLGDSKAEGPLLEAFGDTLANSDYLRRTILEAVGKSASGTLLPDMSTTSTYLRTDTLLLEGQALGIYRYALRNIVHPAGTNRMADFLIKRNYPSSVRLIAANYLQRAKGIAIDSFALDLTKEFQREDDPYIRMALAIGLGKSQLPEVREVLLQQLTTEKDYRVKCNILRTLANFNYARVQPALLAALDDPNLHVSQTAARFFVDSGNPIDAVAYWRKAKGDSTLHWQTRMSLYAAANKFLPLYFEVSKGQLNQELRNIFAQSNNPYEKGAALDALAEFGWNYRIIKEQGFSTTSPIVRTACVQALAKIASNPGFNSFFGLGSRKVKTDLATFFKEAIQSGDAGMMAEAANVLSNADLDFKSVVEESAYLTNAQLGLQLPKDTETYNALQKAIDYFAGASTTVPSQPDYNHPIDWRIVSEVSESARALIKTPKGDIRLRFFPDAAPGTVANFVQLVRSAYYNGKNFHRVVPNFVVQGGGSRGDGYGGLNYSIRSELPQMYYNEEGFVGMASAGNHTECTQFFITHSPTPHLDGNYTIFAKVEEGMEVVHQLEVGDQIQRITISN